MVRRIIHRLKTINPWHFLWISALASIIFGLIFNTIQSYLWWGYLSRDLLLIGIIDGLFVPLLVAPIVIYFVRNTARLEELNKTLQIEVAKAKQSSEKALMESEALYRSIIEDQTEFINRFLPDGTVLFINEAACGFFRMRREEFIGSNFMHLLPEEDQARLKQVLGSLTPENPVASLEHRVFAPDGSVSWHHWTNRAIFGPDGKPVRFQAVGRDITARKKAEEALQAGEALYRSLFENAPVGIGIAEMNGALIAFNDAMLAPGGYTRGDMAAIKNVSELYYTPEERDRALAVFREQGFLQQFPVQFKSRNGMPYDTLLSLRPVAYQGRPCIQAMVEDITARKKIKDALRLNEQRYRELFEDSPIAICEIDTTPVRQYLATLNGASHGDMKTYYMDHPEVIQRCAALLKIVDMNSAMIELFGAKTKEDLMQKLAYIFHEESYNFFREDILMIMKDSKSYEHESVAQTLAGEKIHVFIKWFSASGHNETGARVIVSFIDITRLKQAENSLEESKDRLRFALESADLGMWDWDIDAGRGNVTRENQRIFGLPEDNLAPKTEDYLVLIHPDDKEKVSQAFIYAAETGSLYNAEYRICRPDGIQRWVHSTGKHMVLPDGHIHFIGISEDISQRKQAELDLLESREWFRKLLETMNDGFGIQDETGTIIYVNERLCQMVGYSADEMVGRPLSSFLDEENKRLLGERIAVRVKGDKTPYDLKWTSKNGDSVYTLVSPQAIFDGRGQYKGSFATITDITIRTHLEQALQENETRLRTLSDNIPGSLVYQIDSGEDGQQRRFSYISAGVEQMHGITMAEAMKDPMSIYGQVVPEDRIHVAEEEALAVAKMRPLCTEARLQLPSGELRWRLFCSAPRRLQNNHIVWDGVEIDITERKRVEFSLKESEDRFRLALHNSPISVFNQDKDLRFTWIYNPRKGFMHTDIIGKTDSDFFDADDHLSRLLELKRNVIERGIGRREEIRLTMGGRPVYYDAIYEPLFDTAGSVVGLTCAAIDITQHKQHEELIRSYQEQLSLLSSRLSLVEEKERRRIAMDLHDNIGQILACAKLKLGEIKTSCRPDFSATLDQIYGLVDKSISYTRSLTSELSVPILYEMGLEPAVAWLGREFQKNYPVEFLLRDDGKSKPLKEETRVVLFKSIRELLLNVAKHSHAKKVTVSMARKNSSIWITVEDDGVGFDVADTRTVQGMQSCFGLFSIREAIKNSGGSMEVVSAPGRHTKIILTAPLEK